MINSKQKKGYNGKSEFNQNIEFIKTEILNGSNATSIYNHLSNSNKVTIDISVFRRYVRQLREQMNAEHGNSAPFPTPLSASSVEANRPQTDPVKSGLVFKPKPADLDAEFSDDGDPATTDTGGQ